MKRFLLTGFLPLVLVIFLADSCSTKKNTFVTRNYHNLTSRFNGYFYAKESMKEARYKINHSYVDDYSQMLPLYRNATTSETKSSYPDLEKAIQKSSMVIERHAITDRHGTEVAGAVKWIDDNYLLIGKARYTKGEYLSALQTFDYVTRKYSAFPIKYDGILWKAKTNIELNGYTEAESQLDMLASDKACPKTLQSDIQGTYADLYLHTGKYDLAVKYLEKAIELSKDKKERTRFTYVLGQVYQKQGDSKKASSAYSKVIAMNPEYEMLFNARINNARMSSFDPKRRVAVRRELEKMLNDVKNKEYQDVIYYTLAEIDMRAGKEDEAVRELRLSVAANMGNNHQKALSYLALAEIFFKRTEYTTAEAYYDSTMGVLPRTYPDYDRLDETRKSLNTLVRYLRVVQREDSLQNVVNTYGSDTTKLYAYIDKLIQKVKDDEKKRQEEQDRRNNGFQPNNLAGSGNNTSGSNNNSGGTWYFYNPSTVSFGISEFNKKWGNRKLEDNWRRSNKETILDNGSGDPNDTAAGPRKNVVAQGDNKTRAYYLKNLPMKPELIDSSNGLIADAYYNIGSIYKEQIHNDDKAIDAFNKLTERFATHKYCPPSHFQLYRLYKAKKDEASAKAHADWLRKNYPNSEYVRILDNPDKVHESMDDAKNLAKFYEETYEKYYLAKDYTTTMQRCREAEIKYGSKHEYAGRFSFIYGMSLGYTSGVDSLEKAMTRVTISFPRDPVKMQAQAILDAIHRQRGDLVPAKDSVKTVAPLYTYKADGPYQIMVLVANNKGNINKCRSAISDFNSANFASENYAVSSMLLDPSTQLIIVKSMNGSKKALEYYNMMKQHPELFAELPTGSYNPYLISAENFTVFFKDKRQNLYKDFFENEVLKAK